ncbi:hypothetical protein LJC16_03770, partial [Bacteroidales bacterium OttesenSCG-928-C19]|nr:hypothetical protein [Bacteroidales bacterium OttesenSCG-928-C19]
MKHIILTLINIALFTGCGQGQNKQGTTEISNVNLVKYEEKIILNDEVLNGKIKTIYEKRIYNNGIDSFAYFFNELGLLIVEESSLFAGLNTKKKYTYNSDNQRIKTIMYDNEGNQTNYIEFTYENGCLIKRFYKHAKST